MRAIVLTLSGLLTLIGCAAERDPDAKGSKGDAGDTAVQVIRTKGRARNQNDVRQLALFYKMYELDRGKPPADWNELKTFIGNEGPNLIKLVEEGVFVVVYQVQPRSDLVVAYEKEPSQGERLLVALGDGSVQILSPPELNAKLEQQAKPR